MGGNSLKNVHSVRVNKETYKQIENEVLEKVKNLIMGIVKIRDV